MAAGASRERTMNAYKRMNEDREKPRRPAPPPTKAVVIDWV
jgi:hypothetical protein